MAAQLSEKNEYKCKAVVHWQTRQDKIRQDGINSEESDSQR